MLTFAIPTHGGPGDGSTYFPVGGIPDSMCWPTGNGREDLYRLIRDGYEYKYVHDSGDTLANRNETQAQVEEARS